MSVPCELDIRLFRVHSDTTQVELRFTDPESGDVPRDPVFATVAIDVTVFGDTVLGDTVLGDTTEEPAEYGVRLGRQLFGQAEVAAEFAAARAAAAGRGLRLRLAVDPTALDLQRLCWELLTDENGQRITQAINDDTDVLFSRFLFSQDWRPIRLHRRGQLKTVIAVAAPDLSSYGVDIHTGAEVRRARRVLDGAPATTVDGDVTLDQLVSALRDDIDVLYLVGHCFSPPGEEPYLYLSHQDKKKTDDVDYVASSRLAARLRDLPRVPRLVVLVPPVEDGPADGTPQVTLAPRLAEAGVLAVLAFHGRLDAATVERTLKVFFAELAADGQVDRALAVARRALDEQPSTGLSEAWRPVLFQRMRGGALWYEPSFGEGAGDAVRWRALVSAVDDRRFTPIVGWGLAERLYGSAHDMAHRLGGERFPLAPHQRGDLAMVSQFLQVDQSDSRHALRQLTEQMAVEVYQRHQHLLGPELKNAALARLLRESSAIHRRQDDDPYRVLAELPARIYVNASSDNLLKEALTAAGRTPDILFPRWKSALEPPVYDREPTVERPLIFHIFGYLADDESLVLTEDDHFDFLIGASANRGLVPPVVRHALADSSLLFLGFQLADWSFRVLYRLILSQAGGSRRRRYTHAAVQVDPEGNQARDVARARKYLASYYGDANVSLFWGGSRDFLAGLGQRWTEANTRPDGRR